MDYARVRTFVSAAIVVSLTAFLSAGTIALLLLRLGDSAGATCSAWASLAFAAATLTAVAVKVLMPAPETAR